MANHYVHVIPVGADGRTHQPTRECRCMPTFAIDARGTLPGDDIRVFLHRDPDVQGIEALAKLRATKGKFVEVTK